jgi:predicted alpha/beta hydrolase family esterase
VRVDWVATLDAAIRAVEGSVILVGHSLGCALAVWWAARHRDMSHARKVRAALLAALPDVERADFPGAVRGFAPMPRTPLPFRSIVLASANDPWCELSRARQWAQDWGAQFHDVGARGHLNSDSGLGSWPQARGYLDKLTICE